MNHREQLARQTLADVMKKLYSRGLFLLMVVMPVWC